MGQQGITKKESVILQGIAVLLMIYHHFFNDPSCYGEALSFFQIDTVRKMAWFGKICVGMFAFLSGYGMCRVLEKKSGETPQRSFAQRLFWDYRVCAGQIFRVLLRYWAVFLVSMGVFFALGRREFDLGEFLANFFCLKSTYNGAFWYMGQYIKMMLLLPLCDLFFQKYGDQRSRAQKRGFYAVLAGGLCAFGIAAWMRIPVRTFAGELIEALRMAFILAFLTGYLAARFRVYESVGKRFETRGRPVRIPLGVFLLAAVWLIRSVLARSAAYATLDFALLPFWIGGIVMLLRDAGGCRAVFWWFGSLSTYMWLLHVFVYDLTEKWLLERVQSHFLFYLAQVFLSMAAAMVFWGAEYLLKVPKTRRPAGERDT